MEKDKQRAKDIYKQIYEILLNKAKVFAVYKANDYKDVIHKEDMNEYIDSGSILIL